MSKEGVSGWLSLVTGALDSLGLETAAKTLEKDLGEFIGTVATDTQSVVAKVLEEEAPPKEFDDSSSLGGLLSSGGMSSAYDEASVASTSSGYVVVAPEGIAGDKKEEEIPKDEGGEWGSLLPSPTPSTMSVKIASTSPPLSAIQRLQARLESGETDDDCGWGDEEEKTEGRSTT